MHYLDKKVTDIIDARL